MKQEIKKELKRQAILKSAAACFENRRFDEVTLDEIAVAAGVGKGTLYLYFKSKEDLFLQLAVEGIDEMVTRIGQLTRQEDRPYEERFRILGLALAEFFLHRSGFIRLMHQSMSQEIHRGFHQHRQRMRQAVHGFIQQGLAQHALRTDCSLEALEALWIGPLMLRGRVQKENLIPDEELIKLIWSGVKRI